MGSPHSLRSELPNHSAQAAWSKDLVPQVLAQHSVFFQATPNKNAGFPIGLPLNPPAPQSIVLQVRMMPFRMDELEIRKPLLSRSQLSQQFFSASFDFGLRPIARPSNSRKMNCQRKEIFAQCKGTTPQVILHASPSFSPPPVLERRPSFSTSRRSP